MLRVWKFEGGAGANGTNLAGLSVMLLEKGSENIASAENAAQEAFAYLPEGLEPAQREALVGWVRSQTPASVGEENIRVVPMRAYLWEGNAQVAAGQHIAFSSRRPAPCGPASCGERLWYEPRNAAANFMVEEVASARVSEPALSLSWKDHGRRTLFMGQFGPMEGRTPAFCGNTPGLFTKL
ncbi:hypothetical protein DB346_14760 [Verrucomicrobia bacterium LW23]|nr:hypothetical protein DB346_14760 [Verrucomicrobia bacterium LW23]